MPTDLKKPNPKPDVQPKRPSGKSVPTVQRISTNKKKSVGSTPNSPPKKEQVVVTSFDNKPALKSVSSHEVEVKVHPHPRTRLSSAPFLSVYPQRKNLHKTIGTNPVSKLTVLEKSRLGLDWRLFDLEAEIDLMDETDLQYLSRRFKEICRTYIIIPAITCFLTCRSIVRPNLDVPHLQQLYQPRTQNSTPYLHQLQVTIADLKTKGVRRDTLEILARTTACAISTSTHIEKLILFLDQLRVTVAFSDLYASPPITPIDRDSLKSRSMVGAFVYLITFLVSQLDRTDERLHASSLNHFRRLYLELASEIVILWSATSHLVATAELIFGDLEHLIGKYLFHVRSIQAEVVTLKPIEDYAEQARVRFVLRRQKRIRDDNIVYQKTHWPRRVPPAPRPSLMLVSRVEEKNVQWHPLNLFDFNAQIRILFNVTKRTKDIVADAYALLAEFDAVLHTHRPSRKSPETNTLFEDSIYLKDRMMELNTFPYSSLIDPEVEWVYEIGNILSDKLDELYISLYAAKDVVRETLHVTQLCHEYLRAHELWRMTPFHLFAEDIQKECHSEWDHFDGFKGMELIHKIHDPVPLFNVSVYPSLIRMFPVKVARIFLSFQSPEEVMSRKAPSSHSLFDAFDTIPVTRFPKHATLLAKTANLIQDNN